MGLSTTVQFEPTAALPDWSRVLARLAAEGLPITLRMINGELSFPTDPVPADWRELRVSLPDGAGMVTLRREPATADGAVRVSVVVWGNADAKLLAGSRKIAETLAAEGAGAVLS